MTKQKEYHILSLSGGKDSTALAFFIRDTMPEIHEKIEYVFCDTGCELPETYDYLNKCEIFLGKSIKYIKPVASFDHLIQLHNFLPTPRRRWCTVELKTKPFRKYIHDIFQQRGEGVIYLYIGIRADELSRAEYNKYGDSTIREVYPFVDSHIVRDDVFNILEKNGIGLPEYYNWTSRSGCYFCFFKSKLSWILLHENHPDLYKKAQEMEQPRLIEGGFGWNIDYALNDMIKPKNVKAIKEKYKAIFEKRNKNNTNNDKALFSLIEQADETETGNCIMCHL